MSSAAHHEREEPDEAPGYRPASGGGSRRVLVGVAAGGLALAASGLVLPARRGRGKRATSSSSG